MHNCDITIENISKTEGHAGLDVKVRKGVVKDVRFKILENKRFYTQAIRGKNFLAAPQLMSRICGTCSIAHLLCCIESIENALEVKESEQTKLLKTLAMNGLMIRDHSLHLYMFSLPDVIGKDSILDFDEKNSFEHELLHDCFSVKGAGNNLTKLIAGRSVHAPFPSVGGFNKLPDPKLFPEMVKELKAQREKVLKLIDIYFKCDFDFSRKTNFVAITNKDYDFRQGNLCSSTGVCVPEGKMEDHLEHVVLPYSQASGYKFEGKEFMVGALSRMNLNKQSLNKETKKDVSKYLKKFPSNNIYDNNLAQAIEVLHCIDSSISILESFEPKPEPKPVITPKKSTGIGVIEAPRGTLFYKVELDEKGIIKKGKVVVPTGQNQINIEKDVAVIVQKNLDETKESIQFEIEKLIRAYDPCMSCAAHFLKINWL
ncbi:nickel-dependent hydrogenase large subunit [Candidatus Micrarchaeota archaeon]|nr:nickel-dependent hydrogenase large subunit [Candidatus Micrarchaeota archaeon]MBU2476331.1 nickel-dependent hydrogenase large subunit [Candidatus Micrarchaeota archaeon]